ncbi:MAG: VOC family protein [Alphaproteobacteria bacterium]
MEQRVSVITLAVNNIEEAVGFYKAMGFKPTAFGDEHFKTFQMNGLILGLYPNDHLVKDAGHTELKPAGTFGGIALAYNVRAKEEVDAFLADAVAAGGTITRPAEEQFWGGYSGYFTDLDGHGWEVAWNPHWPIDADGNIFLPE